MSDAAQVGGPVRRPRPRPTAVWRVRTRNVLRITDLLTITAAVFAAQVVRFGDTSNASVAFSNVDYWMVSVGIIGMWLTALTVQRTRSPRMLGNGIEETRRVLVASMSVFGVIAVLATLFKLDIARGYLAIALPLGAAALTANRWLIRRYVAHLRLRGGFVNSVLAVGSPHSIRTLAECFARHPADGLKLVGVTGPELGDATTFDVSPTETVRVLPRGMDIEQAVVDLGADTVVLASGHLAADEIRALSWQLESLGVDLVMSPGMVDVAVPRLTMWLVGGQPLIHVDKPQYSGAKHFQKRAFDLVFSTLVLLAAAPVMIAVAFAIKLTSRGPVFYLSERIGLDGTPFQMVKFRSMVVDAEQRLAEVAHLNDGDGTLFKIRRDPRVTPVVGSFLRRLSIDEIPQFFNVLRGQMSVVGPRPPLPSEAATYDMQTRRRLLVRPGITGLWQVSGRSDLSWNEAVRLDLSYVENWSMSGDLVIAFSTVRAVFARSGAY